MDDIPHERRCGGVTACDSNCESVDASLSVDLDAMST